MADDHLAYQSIIQCVNPSPVCWHYSSGSETIDDHATQLALALDDAKGIGLLCNNKRNIRPSFALWHHDKCSCTFHWGKSALDLIRWHLDLTGYQIIHIHVYSLTHGYVDISHSLRFKSSEDHSALNTGGGNWFHQFSIKVYKSYN